MYAKYYLAIGLLLTLATSPLIAGDLYLLSIKNEAELSRARDVVGHAHGTIDGKFLVELDEKQVGELSSSGMSPELVTDGYIPGTIYIISSENPRLGPARTGMAPLYSSERSCLARLESNQIRELAAGGFSVEPVISGETPFFIESTSIGAPVLGNYPADTLADLVNQDSLFSYVSRLEAFRSRCIYGDSINASGRWIADKFREFGYSTVYEDWFTGWDVHNNRECTAFNVVCHKPGVLYPNKYVVIGAHYDSYHWRPTPDYYNAPGADDNASGTAAVLELARIFANIDCNYTMIFSPFSAEEVGKVGSAYMAANMREAGDSIIYMLNFDMIGTNTNPIDSVQVMSGVNHAFSDVFYWASQRVSSMTPDHYYGPNSGSDDLNFNQQGYATVSFMEWNFSLHYHMASDSAVYLSFPYMEEVVRCAAASVGIIDKALPAVYVNIRDAGNGQSLRVEIKDYHPEYTYEIYYGDKAGGKEGFYSDTAVIEPGSGSCDLVGLIPGKMYHLAAMAMGPDGYTSIERKEDSLAPQIIPRKPALRSTNPDSMFVIIVWRPNSELDLDHYRLLRKENLGSWSLLADGITDTVYSDFNIQKYQTYKYAVLALDHDLNVSDTGFSTNVIPASFDKPLLLVDETASGGFNPTEPQQALFYSTALTGINFDKIAMDDASDRVNCSQAGQYGAIFWVDDDTTSHLMGGSLDSLHWYLGYATDMLLAGFQTVYSVSGPSYFYSGNLFYDNFGISRVMTNSSAQFIGATPSAGWPELTFKVEGYFSGYYPNISLFEAAPYGEVIYRYQSVVPGSYYDNKPVAMAYNTGFGKRVVLGFPLYYLDEASAQILVQKVMAYFAEETPRYGDADNDGRTNIKDITYLINYLYRNGPSPAIMNNADVNGDCKINVKDVTYLIRHLYQSGPAPVAGCVVS